MKSPESFIRRLLTEGGMDRAGGSNLSAFMMFVSQLTSERCLASHTVDGRLSRSFTARQYLQKLSMRVIVTRCVTFWLAAAGIKDLCGFVSSMW